MTVDPGDESRYDRTMIKLHQGKHLRVTKARGFRIGCAYIPHYKSNLDISVGRARSLMVWMGPYIISWDYRKKGYSPRAIDDEARIQSLLDARHNLNHEIDDAFRARWRRKTMAERARMHEVHPEVRRQWQAESDAVKLKEMEDAERDAQD